MLFRRIGLVLLLWLCGLTAALADKRVALLIAADDYRNIRPLANPANDARALEAVLEKLDFQVFIETNRDLKRTRRALEDFKEDAAGADVALLFFAGHGVAIDGVNYLLPTDADASSAERLAATSLPLAEAQAAIQSVAPVAIILLDACRDDPFSGGGTEGRGAAALDDDPPTAPRPKPGLGRIGRADGVLFAFAAAPGETASDGDGQNSPFTSALVRHFATAGVELRTALTLVQQDVYDRSRGKQLPYIESGLPELVFITGQGALPERDQLLIAMASLTPDIRAEVETLATARNLPLAPLYAALLSADLERQTPEERAAMLTEAAQSYEKFQSELQKFQSDDPRVAALRAQAEEQLTLGAFDAARSLLTDAAQIDATARTTIKETYLSRTLSEAATHMLNANAARTDLRYDLAISDLTKAAALYAEVADQGIDRDAQFSYTTALTSLGELHLVAGNTEAAWSAYSARATFAQTRVESDPTDVDWVRELVWSLNDLGSVLQQQGYLREAETAYSSALEFSQWQADQRPDDVDLMRDRQVAVNRVGSIRLARRNGQGALDAHVEALGIAQTLLDSDPTNVTYRMDISYTQERIGDAKLDLGDKEGAKAAFETALAISEALVADYPGDTVIRRNLSVSYERIGDMLVDEGDYPAALDTYGKALTIREELAALDPDNKPRQRDLAINFDRIGDTQRFIGDTDSALLAHQAALSIRQNLAALDPTNMVWQQDLLVSLDRMGDLHFGANDFVAALDAQETARAIAESIVALSPDDPTRQADLGLALQKIADIKAAMGDSAGARDMLQSALTLRLAVADADPLPRLQRDAALSLIAMAELDLADGNPAAAEPLIADAVGRQTLLAGAAPGDTLALRDLSIAQNIHASTLMQLGRNSEAVSVATASLETADRLLQLGPEVPDHMHDRLVTLNRLGDAQVALGDNLAAVRSFKAMVDQGNRLLDVDPYSTAWANDLALALDRLGNAQSATGDVAAALKSHQDALALRDWLVAQDPSNPLWYRNLALSHANVATALSDRDDFDTALVHQEDSLRIMRDLAAAYPDDPWYRIDVVRALDQTAVLLQDPAAQNREALAILEEMQATGSLPQGYDGWIAGFRKALGLPTDF
ncbi:caspase family protein [Tabrizicola sp.]|uniref:caspase family protein n=1 Tax=Tabrizicola sp. TaxID=2005166 RepID=UPI0027356AF9|nr:caspase family protein [Tabrizicola sp.]MDP3197996.1 caspase family protein [Tabrizicola sp.]